MIKRSTSFIIAISCFAGFWGSLLLALHGAVAVLLAVGFFTFFSAGIDQRTKVARIFKWVLGLYLTIEMFRRLILYSEQNYVFTFTVGVCGLLLLIDPIVLWITRPKTPNHPLKRDEVTAGVPE